MHLGESRNLSKKGIQFLIPCKAEVKMRQEYGRRIPYYTANFESIYLNMTPTLYEVVMGVVSTITLTGLEKHAIEEKKQSELRDLEPFQVYHIDRKTYFSQYAGSDDQLVDVDEIDARSVQEKIVETRKTRVLEALDLQIGEFVITFCEEAGLDLQPLAIVKMQLDGRVSNWTKNIHCKADLTLEAVYYNDFLSTWEPLIENVMQTEDHYRPWILSLWFAMEPGTVLKPPLPGKKIENEKDEFPVRDLDYTKLNDELKIFSELEPPRISQLMSRVSSSNSMSTNQMFSGSIGKKMDMEAQNISSLVLQTANYIMIESKDVLNLNVTPSAYKVFSLRLDGSRSVDCLNS
jgi:hypothetical protein